jgi:hypothetical protein
MRTLLPKRPEASVDGPISLQSTFDFPVDDPGAQALAKRLHDVLQVGGDVAIPGRFVQRFEVIAASDATRRLIGDDERVGDLEILSVPVTDGFPMHGALVLTPSGIGRAELTLPVTFTHRLGAESAALCAEQTVAWPWTSA